MDTKLFDAGLLIFLVCSLAMFVTGALMMFFNIDFHFAVFPWALGGALGSAIVMLIARINR